MTTTITITLESDLWPVHARMIGTDLLNRGYEEDRLMPYIIRMAPGHVTTLGDNAQTLTYRFNLAHEAANQLQRLAECVEQAGGTGSME